MWMASLLFSRVSKYFKVVNKRCPVITLRHDCTVSIAVYSKLLDCHHFHYKCDPDGSRFQYITDAAILKHIGKKTCLPSLIRIVHDYPDSFMVVLLTIAYGGKPASRLGQTWHLQHECSLSESLKSTGSVAQKYCMSMY